MKVHKIFIFVFAMFFITSQSQNGFAQPLELVNLKLFTDDSRPLIGQLHSLPGDSIYILELNISLQFADAPDSIDAGIFDEGPNIEFHALDQGSILFIYDHNFAFLGSVQTSYRFKHEPVAYENGKVYFISTLNNSSTLNPDFTSFPAYEADDPIPAEKLVFSYDLTQNETQVHFSLQNPPYMGVDSDILNPFDTFSVESLIAISQINRNTAFSDDDGNIHTFFDFFGEHTLNSTETLENTNENKGFVHVEYNYENDVLATLPIVSENGTIYNYTQEQDQGSSSAYRTGWVRGHGTHLTNNDQWLTAPGDSLYHSFLTSLTQDGNVNWSSPLLSFNNNNPDTSSGGRYYRGWSKGMIEFGTNVFVAHSYQGKTEEGDSLLLKDFFGDETKYYNLYNDSANVLTSRLLAPYSHNIFKIGPSGNPLSWLKLEGTSARNHIFNYSSSFHSSGKLHKVGDIMGWSFDHRSVSDTMVYFVKQGVSGVSDTTTIELPTGFYAYVVWVDSDLNVFDNWVIPYTPDGGNLTNSPLQIDYMSKYQGDTILIQGKIGANTSSDFDPNDQSTAYDIDYSSTFVGFYSAPELLDVADGKHNASTFKIYPNPTSVGLFLQNPFQNEAIYTILDMAGRAVAQGKIARNSPRFRIDVSTLPSGFYLINITSESRSVSEKLIIR
jgi:hypothetical protein